MDERAVNELRRLAALDADLTERASALRGLDASVAALRGHAEAIDAFLAAYPDEQARRGAELTDARDELQRRREELAEAQRSLAEAHDDEARIHAEGRSARAQSASDELEHDATALPRELEQLQTRARAVPGVPPPGSSLVEWASHAHAELFVAAGQIDVQRERVIREANELATMLLGEQTYGATVAQALARVEALWTSSPGHVS